MVEKARAEETQSKSGKTNAAGADKPGNTKDRRRLPLPQPNYAPYKKINAYPGRNYFFVGHSYNVECNQPDRPSEKERAAAIKATLKLADKEHNFLSLPTALSHKSFQQVLSRFEREWLPKLPETVFIGPAINENGAIIPHAFTVWRKELRKSVPASTAKELAAASI